MMGVGGGGGGGVQNSCIPNLPMDLGEGANYIPRIDLNLVLIVVF